MQKLKIKIIERLLYDQWVRSGRNLSTFKKHLFRNFNRSRINRISESHPFYKFKLLDEQSTPFSFSRNSLIWLFAQMQISKPSSILEMGSGLSTIAHAIYSWKAGKKVSISSMDHDQSWLDASEVMLKKRNGFSGLVDFYYSPIADDDFGEWGKGYFWPENLNGPFDWVLIDGPPSRVGRTATLPIVWPFLNRGANIFLDDAERPGEQKAILKWTEYYGSNLILKNILPLGKGLAWLVKNE